MFKKYLAFPLQVLVTRLQHDGTHVVSEIDPRKESEGRVLWCASRDKCHYLLTLLELETEPE